MSTLEQGMLLFNQSLADYTSWRVGGCAKQLYKPQNIVDLVTFLMRLPKDENVIWLGLGSNVLVRDAGIAGTVVITQGALNQLTHLDEFTIRAEAGVSCATAARFAARLNLRGVEFLAGIPGTIGGALAMNAGCFGSETWKWVSAVETIDREGERHLRKPSDFQISYRHVLGKPNEWFVAGHFQLEKGDKEQSLQTIKTLLARRAITQPTNEPSCGSVFRNPPGDYAGRLIEACGLKQYAVGGASVSDKHANFIVNKGTATAADIEALIQYVAEKVEKKFAIRLEREVHIIGSL